VRLPFRGRSGSQPFTEQALWVDLDKRIEPFKGYKEALRKLEAEAPPGYALVFGFHYVYAEILNGGISQLHANPTWSLLLKAIEAARLAGRVDVERLLREALLYYREQGRSRFKRQITDDFFADLDRPLGRSLKELDGAIYHLGPEQVSVVPKLLAMPELWRQQPAHRS
jgi:hypothetical protein